MRANEVEIKGNGETAVVVSVEYGEVNVACDSGDNAPMSSSWLNSTKARTLADALLRAADEAEGITSPEDPRLTLARLKAFIEDMYGWCSPHGIAADYSDRLMAVLEGK